VPGTKRAVGNWKNGFFSSFVGPQTSIRPCLGCKQGRLLAGLLGSRGLFFWSWPAITASAAHNVFLSQASEGASSTRVGEALHASRLPVAARVSRTFSRMPLELPPQVSLPRSAQFYSISSSHWRPATERWFQRGAGGIF